MFHRRRASSNPPKIAVRQQAPPPPTASAASAAAQAFIKDQQNHGNLSSAAAAAALRSHSTTPTPVGNVQTKRMQRRDSNGSAISNGSHAHPGMERRGSASSMTERSFRSPSPGRGSPHVRAAPDAPPVPPVPREVGRTPTARMRAASVEPPLRVSSPPPAKQGGRGVSLDRAPRQPASPRAKKAPRLSNVTELEREESRRSSVNFSRPMPPSCPASTDDIQNGHNGSSPSSPTTGTSGWFTAPVTSDVEARKELESLAPSGTSAIAPAEVSGIQQAVQGVADKPVKKKKKKKITPAAAGSHLTSGTMGLTGTALQPPAEIEPSSYNTRAGTLLARQPSLVDETPELLEAETANTGRKIDVAAKTPLNTSKLAAVSPVQSKPLQPAQQTPQSSTDRSTLAVRTESPGSHSPSRSAHFGAAPTNLLNGTRHQPPDRSVSPMKSALKHSPSSSVQGTSPQVRSARSASLSDSLTAKRKSARVSFDESPTVVAAGLEASKYASKSPSRAGEVDELNNGMKPTPALPTFGSVRGRKPQTEPMKTEAEIIPDSMSSSQGTLVGLDLSNDHGVGGIIAQDLAAQKAASEPFPPVTTSVEGAGYNTDSELNDSYGEKVALARAQNDLTRSAEPATTKITDEPEPLRLIEMAAQREHSHAVPAIAILPATPAAEEVDRELSIPGAFPESDVSSISSKRSLSSLPQSQTAAPLTAQALRRDGDSSDSSDSDNDSVYSDAAEDPSEFGGFASLNAIMESSTMKRSPGLVVATGEDSTYVPPQEPSPSWNETTAYWKNLSERRKQEIEERAVKAQESSSEEESESEEESSDEEEAAPVVPVAVAPVEPARPVTPPKAKTIKTRAHPVVAAPSNNTRADLAAVPQQAKPSVMKQSLRSSPQSDVSEVNGTHLRGTMRNSGTMPSTMRGTMRGPQPGLESSRWSTASPAMQPKGALQKKNIPMGPSTTRPIAHQRASSGTITSTRPAYNQRHSSATIVSTTVPVLRRTGSADSASSFKRQRGSSHNRGDGRINMRRSMRDNSPQDRPLTSPQAGRGSSRFRVRSLSPAGSSAPIHMRSSMRNSVGTTPSLRSQKPAKTEKKSRLRSPAGFGRKSKPVDTTPPKPSPLVASRFAADSDDDEPRSAFVSRFADSDDEDVDLPPVRGIPKRRGEVDGDSTDLEGESSDERQAFPPVPTFNDIEAAHTGKSLTKDNAEGSILAGGSLRHPAGDLYSSKHAPRPEELNKRRFSFLSMGSSKKRSSSVPPQKLRPASSGGETASLRSPKLQRRNTPNKLALVPEDSWPLPSPQKIGVVEDDRPNTSEGFAGAPPKERPNFAKRRSTNDALGMTDKEKRRVSFGLNGAVEPVPVYSGRTGKKKKFGTLRRMFGLND
ncbi:hypothetical protein EG328_002293 [Venturia inaequalis]|uniref:Uncharacterized protein n=1 Tax=Venturia inaequalis TaxID=5025 RepID=A0A8H3V344_VENIN|nr:hypothetical protein EG328_002293 [Venturia inaequalis]KAE9981256.1 hypothetical protein EG327_006267 [Venturia inaequalis]RDI78628.1 hypothetical protein Vi05172_g11357 [Venturia inaequalis]